MNTIKTITLIGSGNVATNLGKALLNKGFEINEVYSKSLKNASRLASELNTLATDNIEGLDDNSDLYLICLKDDVIEGIVQRMPSTNKIIAHTSGSVSIKVIDRFESYGIVYPLQTFSKEKLTDVSAVPFCIEANSNETEQRLLTLAKVLTENVHLINSEQRKKIHLAAVFACNFTNYMYTVAEDILAKDGIDMNLLKPLIIETAKKIQNNPAALMQTGPAKRKDEDVIKNHLEMLADSEAYQDIYKIITDNIIKTTDGKL